MKSELLRKALMSTYQDGGKVKKKIKSKSDVGTQYVKDIPKDAIPAVDASGNQMYDDKGRKMYKRSTMNEPDTKIGQPKKGGDKVYNKTKGTTGKPNDWVKPYKQKDPTGTESSEYFVQDVVEPTTPPPVTPKMAFGWEGEMREDFGEQGNAPVFVNGKPVRLQTYSIPAQYDEKTGAWNSNTGNMNPTKVRGYVGADGNFVAVKQELSPNPATVKYQNKDIMAYTPESLVPWGNKGEGEKLRKEGAIRATGATTEMAKAIGNQPVTTDIKETIAPVNTTGGGLGIGKDAKLEIKKDSIAPAKGVNLPLDTMPYKKGGLVAKYGNGGPIINPYIKQGIKDIYNQSETTTDGVPTEAPKGPNDISKNFMGGTKLKNMTGNQKSQLTGLASLGTDALAAGIDAADRKDDNSSIGGQAASSGIRYGGKGLALGMNPALMAATGGTSAAIGAGLGAAYGLYKGTKNAIKEDKEYNQVGADMIRDNAQASLNYDPSAPDTFKGQNRKQEGKGLKKLFGFAKGGTIKGEGTGTSDSIETKVGNKGIPEGSFIVPAKNNGLAKLIRKDVLGDKKDKVAGFKKGGNTDMAVSNGEHLFTPKEKQKITAYLGQEILEKLAPEAEEGEDKNCGGMIKKYKDGGWVKGNGGWALYDSKGNFIRFSKTDPNSSTSSKGLATKVAKPKTAIEEKFTFENMTPKEVTLPVSQGSDMSQFDPSSVTVEDKTGYDPRTGMYKSTVTDTQTYGLPQADNQNGKMNWADAAGMGLSGLQAGYGLQQLMKDKRPIDRLDPAYNKLTNEAIANSQFGYTPEQKSMLQQQIVQGKNAQVANINSMAGGNAAVGLANARAAINNMYTNNLKLASEDERLRMQKAQYAGAMAGNRANMSRQLFADNMNAFQQKQQAGSELLGSGIRNLVGSIRLPQERAHQESMNKLIYGV